MLNNSSKKTNGILTSVIWVYSLMLLGSIEYHSMPGTSAGSKDEAENPTYTSY